MQQFSTQEVSKVTKASIRRLDYWARTGLLTPSVQDAQGSGSKRRYTFRDIVAAQTIQQLRERFCPLQKVRIAVQYLRKHYPDQTDSETLSRLTLITDGKKVYMLSDVHQVMEVITKQLVWSVPLGQLIVATDVQVRKMPQKWTEKVRVRDREYHLEMERDQPSGEFTVQCRELPGAIEQGRTVTEAIENGKQAVDSVLAFMERREGATRTPTGAQRVANR